MKKTLLSILFFIACLKSFSFSGYNEKLNSFHKTSFDSSEVFVSITYNDINNFTSVKAAITAMSGVNYLAYCTNHAVFMLYVDTNIYATKEIFLDQLLKTIPQHTFIINIKQGSFNDFANYCTAIDETEAATLKTKFAN